MASNYQVALGCGYPGCHAYAHQCRRHRVSSWKCVVLALAFFVLGVT
jgi:Na+-translocating ferredoxin:NAD+ oxidoreductase RNF subunit RnfB